LKFPPFITPTQPSPIKGEGINLVFGWKPDRRQIHRAGWEHLEFEEEETLREISNGVNRCVARVGAIHELPLQLFLCALPCRGGNCRSPENGRPAGRPYNLRALQGRSTLRLPAIGREASRPYNRNHRFADLFARLSNRFFDGFVKIPRRRGGATQHENKLLRSDCPLRETGPQ
jgi:hypothetical protein